MLIFSIMKVYITRHGETDWNAETKLCGSTDIPLNDRGRKQARELSDMIAARKDELNIKYIYTSDMERAVETASYTEEKLGIKSIQDIRLREMDFGALEGEDWSCQEAFEVQTCAFQRFQDGESTLMVAHRAYSFLDEMVERHKGKDGNILIVCHGIMARMLCTYFRSYKAREFMKLDIPNCAFVEFEI